MERLSLASLRQDLGVSVRVFPIGCPVETCRRDTMDPAAIALIGVAIGALAGLGGATVAALASIRSSQLAARTPLAKKIHVLNQTVVQITASAASKNSANFTQELRYFMVAWNDLAVHQKILAPSKRISTLNDLVLKAAEKVANTDPWGFANLAGQTLNVITEMVAAHSRHMFRWQATYEEEMILRRWLASDKSQIMGPQLRGLIDGLVDS